MSESDFGLKLSKSHIRYRYRVPLRMLDLRSKSWIKGKIMFKVGVESLVLRNCQMESGIKSHGWNKD